MRSIPGGIDGVEAVFDDDSLVAGGGLLLAGSVMERLGLEALVDEVVRPPGSGSGSGARVLSLVASMLAGGSFIDDADRLRSGASATSTGTVSRSNPSRNELPCARQRKAPPMHHRRSGGGRRGGLNT